MTLKIWIFFCLLGLAGNFISDLNQSVFTEAIVEVDSATDSNGIDNSILFSTPHPYLFLAENLHEISTEIEPKNTIVARWESHVENFSKGKFYVHRSLRFSLSQSVRNMIFPFHSYL